MIEEYIKLGKINKLEVYKEVEFGVYLKSKEENDEVLLPKRYAKGLKIGDIVDVFVYSDSEDRYVATTNIPFATLGEFGIFEVVDTSEFGAFVEWGLPKHLFVPLSTQKRKLKKEGGCFERVCIRHIVNVSYSVNNRSSSIGFIYD